MTEQLDPFMYQQLCIEFIKDYRKNPEIFHSFVMSGKEPFNSFLDVCRSIKFLDISNVKYDAVFYDLETCKTFSSSGLMDTFHSYFITHLFKHAKSVRFNLDVIQYSEYDWFMPHLTELESLEEIEIQFSCMMNIDYRFLSLLLELIGPVKRMTAAVDVFEAISRVVTDYKLDKMTVVFYLHVTLENLLRITNIFPTELDMKVMYTREGCPLFVDDVFFVSGGNFDAVKKLTLRLDSYFSQFDDDHSSLVFEDVELIKMWFPNVEELAFEYDVKFMRGMYVNRRGDAICPTVDRMEAHITLLKDALMKCPGGLKIKVNLLLRYEHDLADKIFVPYLDRLKKAANGFQFSSAGNDNFLKKHVYSANNHCFDAEVKISKITRKVNARSFYYPSIVGNMFVEVVI